MTQRLLILLFWIASLPVLEAAPETKVVFNPNSFPNVKQQAARENRPFFAYFTAQWCAPCRIMDESTWQYQELADYVDDHYFAVKVDVDDFDGIGLKQQFKVEAFPTIILFAPDGQFLKRLEGGVTGTKLLATLQAYDNYESITTPKPVPVSHTGGSGSSSPNRPPLPPSTPPPPADPVPNVPPAPVINPTPAPTGGATAGLFRFTVARQPSVGYSVQVGVYAEYENVLREVQKYQLQFSQPVLVHIDKLANRTVYRILIGDFGDQAQASQYQKKVAATGLTKAFVKDLSTIF